MPCCTRPRAVAGGSRWQAPPGRSKFRRPATARRLPPCPWSATPGACPRRVEHIVLALPQVRARAVLLLSGRVRSVTPWKFAVVRAFALPGPSRVQRCVDRGASRNQYGPSPQGAALPGWSGRAKRLRSVCRRAAYGRAALARTHVRLVVARMRLGPVWCVCATAFVRDRSRLGIISRRPMARVTASREPHSQSARGGSW